MDILVVSDLHGKKEACYNAIQRFKEENWDKIVFLGDYCDSWDRSNEDIYSILHQIITLKEENPDNVIILLGNHELHYMYPLEYYRCSGYRPDLAAMIETYLQENRAKFQVAYQIENYLFTHAGVQKKWFTKYGDDWGKWQNLVDCENDDVASVLNAMMETEQGRITLFEVGLKRGGLRYDYGGPLWCDRDEMMSYGPLPGYHQIVGHTPQKFINRQDKFEGDKHYNNTSVTFCDVLDKKEQFYTLNIKT